MAASVKTASRLIPAPAQRLFDLVADPSQHPAFDGSGTVRSSPLPSGKVGPGDTFGMSMHMYIPYKMVNEVVEYEEGRRFAWTPKLDGPGILARRIGPVIWRYEFEEVEGGTLVTETWDPTRSKQRGIYGLVGMEKQVTPNMERTLERLERLALGD
ncbi:MAG: SRPBCC family protein [Actinomycetes bacterium]